jgi:hypothetical protein
MPPLQLNDEEMNVLLTLAGPIDHQLRPQFLQEVAQVVSNGGAAPRHHPRSRGARFIPRSRVTALNAPDSSGAIRGSPPIIDREARREG